MMSLSIVDAWEMTEKYRTFIEAALDAKIALLPDEVYMLATRIMADPRMKAEFDKKFQSWYATDPYSALDVSDDPDPDAPNVEVVQPDFYLEVARELGRNEKVALRKKYAGG